MLRNPARQIIRPLDFCDSEHFSAPVALKTVVKFRPDSPVWPRCRAGVTHNVLAPRSFRSEVFLAWKIGPLLSLRFPSNHILSRRPTGVLPDAALGFLPLTVSPG